MEEKIFFYSKRAKDAVDVVRWALQHEEDETAAIKALEERWRGSRCQPTVLSIDELACEDAVTFLPSGNGYPPLPSTSLLVVACSTAGGSGALPDQDPFVDGLRLAAVRLAREAAEAGSSMMQYQLPGAKNCAVSRLLGMTLALCASKMIEGGVIFNGELATKCTALQPLCLQFRSCQSLTVLAANTRGAKGDIDIKAYLLLPRSAGGPDSHLDCA